jgi:putative peptidoglycan lipid II flippase
MVAGFTAEARELTLHMVHIMALSMPASVLINCLAAGEVAIGRTRMTNIRAATLNVGIIIGLGLLVLTKYNYVLGWAFAGAFNALAVWGVWRMVAEGNLSFSGVTPRQVLQTAREFLVRLRPFLFLPGAEQANVWLERLLASRIVTGAVASLDYARTLTDSILLLLSQPVGLAFLADNNRNDEREEIQKIARPLLAAGVPFAAFVYAFSEDIVRLVFQRGAFGEHGVMLTSQALSGVALGMWASTVGWVLLRLLNRSNRNTKAAIILISAYAANFAMNLVTQTLWSGTGVEVFMLGLGETTRSLVLLLGVALALNCSGALMRLLLIALVPAGCLMLAEWQLLQHMPASFERLVLGGLLWGLATLAAAWLLCPALLRFVILKAVSVVSRRKR